MPDTMTYTGTLVIKECYKCHITFAMPKDFQRRCPCCNRSFAQLQRHMASKHPGYAENDGA